VEGGWGAGRGGVQGGGGVVSGLIQVIYQIRYKILLLCKRDAANINSTR